MAEQTRGRCVFCERELTRGGMSRHLATCAAREAALSAATGTSTEVLRLLVRPSWAVKYWLHLEMRADAPLAELDSYLRAIWLECCGHLSQFHLGPREGGVGKISLKRAIGERVGVGDVFSHIYDFGSPSHSIIEIVDTRIGAPLSEHPIFLMARNNPPRRSCEDCGEEAGFLCLECSDAGDNEGAGMLCAAHAAEHPHEDYGSPLPLCNSPRMGVCGYDGPAEPPY